MTELSNLFDRLPASREEAEQFVELLRQPGWRMERIVSRGHASPDGFWYDQEQSEWVLLASGAARLRFEDEPAPRELQAGDFVQIAAHRRHRVEWTHPDQPSVWLAIHFEDAPNLSQQI